MKEEDIGEIEHKATFNEQGEVVLKKKSKIKMGRRSRAAGARFELKVRRDLETSGWIIDKWTNNVDLENRNVIPAKRKFNPFKKIMSIGTGFPDFSGSMCLEKKGYDLIGVEVKMNGILSKEEKEKCKFLLEKGIFSKILIAKKSKKRGSIDYDDFKEKYGKLFL